MQMAPLSFFGYMNTNWQQQFDIPIGPRNYFSVVEAGDLDDLELDGYDADASDMGQPTHFYPRRNPFLFTIDMPANFGEKEVVWTLEDTGSGGPRVWQFVSRLSN